MEWEYQLTVPILVLDTIMKQVNASHMGQWQVFVIMHKMLDTHIVYEAFNKNGFCQMTPFYWWKGGEHQTKTPVSS